MPNTTAPDAPMAVQIAYAVPAGITFMASAKSEKLMIAETIMAALGQNLVKPSERLSPITIPISKSPARTRTTQAIGNILSLVFISDVCYDIREASEVKEVVVPKVVDHERRRREIAEAVWRAVARWGIEATTVRGIAEEAGFSTGVLAHYFEDKNALILHALHVSIERAAERMRTRSRGKRSTEALRTVLRETLPLDEERRGEMRVWIGFWGRAVGDEALRVEQNHWYTLWRGVVQELIEEGQRNGDFRTDLEAGREAGALVAFVDGIGLQAMFEPERLPPEEQKSLLDEQLSRLRRDA